MTVRRPVLGITMGDPAGIGPEIVVKALSHRRPWRICVPVVLGDPGIMSAARDLVNNAPPLRVVSEVPGRASQGEIMVLPATGEVLEGIVWGRLDARCGRAQVDFVRKAVGLALRGEIDAMVTGPIHKKGLRLAGMPHAGHTEMLAEWTGTREFAMMLVGKRLRVVPATLHLPLREVAAQVTPAQIHRAIHLTDRAMREWFGLAGPRLAVSGLNPHAGDQGLFGTEEEEIIGPAVEACRREGITVEGPLSPDAVFRLSADGRFDAVVAMYHDQGLIPLKLLDRGRAVNLTLGLPIVRTSVDHGTAYDISGLGRASPGSLLAAIELAAGLASKKAAPRAKGDSCRNS